MAPSLTGSIGILGSAAKLDSNAIVELKQRHPLVTDVVVLPQTDPSAPIVPLDVVIASTSENIDDLTHDLPTIGSSVKPGGALHVYVPNVTDANKGSVLMSLMIGGFVDVTDADATDFIASAFLPELKASATARWFTAKKPAFEAGAALSLGKKLSNGTAAPAAVPLKKWTVLADDGDNDDDDDEIIDEDTLLDDTDAVLQAAKDDCGPGVGGKKRACKDCTCGRKDAEDQPVVSDQELTQMVSSCGNCFKGDAFRCGSCPFLGKPSFKPGMEKVLLNLDDADDI